MNRTRTNTEGEYDGPNLDAAISQIPSSELEVDSTANMNNPQAIPLSDKKLSHKSTQ